ncbi:hypothetical protein J5226_09535 [Lysobacter sp. K5869]|nr:hypothetical protein [Lysobacter sp. K5869]QWP78611.1 hypothetical protein J5226_09535 [Lysobacter sp. K5869]
MKRFPQVVSEKRLKASRTTRDARRGAAGASSPVLADGVARSRLLSSGL